MVAGKVLIIDDDPDARLYYKVILDELDLEVAEARDGVEGMERARQVKPDLVILDLMMPRKGGLKVFNEMKEDPELCLVPIIIISGATQETGLDMKQFVFRRPSKENLEKDSTGGPSHRYLEKPIDPDDLVRIVTKLLDL